MILDNVSAKNTESKEGEPASLTRHAFANPKEFLDTLQKNFPKIAQTDPTFISKADLELYASTGSDDKTKAAARIAAAHYDELKNMHRSDNLLPLVRSGTKYNSNVLNYYEIEMESKLNDGNMRNTIVQRELRDGVFLGLIGGNAVVWGLVAALRGNPVMALAAAVGGGSICYMLGKDMYHAPTAIRELSSKTQRNLSSWTEFKA